jgi:predicted ATPase/DNA-binding SARP family transcriptional activator
VLDISVLGPVEARRDGRLLTVPGGRTAELLVRLALDAGVHVRADRLVEDLWGTDAVNTRPNTLQSKVARLRRALGDPPAIASSDRGYALAVEPSAVDALVVLRDAQAASALLEAGDAREAADLSESALQRFRGDVLQAAGDGDWAGLHRARLEETRVQLTETRFAARLALGDAADLVGELEAAVTSHPYQEGLWELLITALYRAGRQAQALVAYQQVRALLADELGLEPGPRLQQLELQILRHDPALASGGRPRLTGNLPSLWTELVGRETEISELCELLGRERLVEIVGTGGIGKTAVAIATGRRLAEAAEPPLGGVWLVRLEGATTSDEVLDAVIAALSATGGEAGLVERLRSAPAVLVLDNCEHVVDAAAALAVRLLDVAPDLRMLCTSQVPLGLDAGAVVELAPLGLEDAVELFTMRAAARIRDAGADDDGLHDLCSSLDGLPLAIELAAARTKTLSIGEITRRLDDRFSVLSDPTSRRPERRRALRATIGWSYELLFPDDQRGLWALATFAGGATLPAVEAVLEALDVPASAAIDVVGRLVGRSLVIVDEDGAAGPVRYRLLDSIRSFASEASAEGGSQERALAAHAAWFADAARSSTEGVRSSEQAEHLSFLRAERANIDAALAWGTAHDARLAVGIATGFGWGWIVLGDSRGAQRILTALEAAGSAAPARDRATALLLAAWLEASTDNLERAHEHIAAAIVLAESIDDVELQARACYHLAYVVSHDGDWARALELTDRSDALYEGLDRPWDQAANWLFAARAAISARDLERAAKARDEVVRRLRDTGDPWLHVRAEAVLGELARIELRFDDAVVHLTRAAETSGRLGFAQTEAYQLSALGRAHCQAGDYTAGAATLELAVEKAEATGDVRLAALARVHLGRVLRALGRREEARRALDAAVAWHRLAGGGEQAALGECLLSAEAARDGEAAAQQRLTAVLDAARRADDAPVEVLALDALARIAGDAGDDTTAMDLGRRADRRMAAAAHFISDRDRVDRVRPSRERALRR